MISFQLYWLWEYQSLQSPQESRYHTQDVMSSHSKVNSVTERTHKYVIETCLSLLHQTSMPQKFWDKVVCKFTFLINTMSTPIFQNKSPFEALFNVLPNYTILKIFGYLCYPNLQPYAQNKFASKYEQCVLIVYNLLYEGYWCLSLH